MTWLLLKYRLKMFLSLFKGGKRLGRTLLLILAFLILAFSMASFAFGIYQFTKLDPERGGMFLESLVAMSFHGMFILLLFWGVSMAIFTIFFSDDLELLLTLPIKSRDIFLYKVGEATFLNARLSLLLLVPVMIIFGIYHQASISYYLVTVIVAVFMAMIPGSLGIILAALISRRIPRARLKGILTIAGSMIGVAIWAVINQFSGQFSSKSADFSMPSAKVNSIIASPIFNYLPSGWAFHASRDAATGQWGLCLQNLVILAGVALLLTCLAYVLTARYYAHGIAEEISEPGRTAGLVDFGVGGSPYLAHIRRDLILFSRESGVITQSLIMALFMLLYPYIAGQQGTEKLMSLPISPVGALFAAFFGGQVGSRLIPLEKLGFWQNLVTPNGRWLTLASKVTVGLASVTLLTIVVSTVHLLTGRINNLDAFIIAIGFAWTGFAVGVPVGIFFGNFGWDHPKRMLKGGGGFLYAILMLGSAVALLAILFLSTRFLKDFINPIFIVIIFASGLMAGSTAVSALKLTNMEWDPEV